jgi:hypothetical protein
VDDLCVKKGNNPMVFGLTKLKQLAVEDETPPVIWAERRAREPRPLSDRIRNGTSRLHGSLLRIVEGFFDFPA